MTLDLLLLIAGLAVGVALVSAGVTSLILHRYHDRQVAQLEEQVIRLRAQLRQRRMPTLHDALDLEAVALTQDEGAR